MARNATKITSRSNEHLKFAKRVRDGKEPDLMFVEGHRLARELFLSGIKVRNAFVTAAAFTADPYTEDHLVDVEVLEVSDDVLSSIADTKSPQGIVLVAERPANKASIAAALEGEADSVLLYQVNNPSNLGAVIRTAEAAGVSSLFISKNSSDPFSPKALRASMGSAFRLQIVSNVDAEKLVREARNAGIRSLAVDAGGSSLFSEKDAGQRLYVFGSEAHGLPSEIVSVVDETVAIPMAAPVESLNLAVACGIVLYSGRRPTI